MKLFKKYKRDLKRISAFLLAATVTIGGVPGLGAMDVRANVLQDNVVAVEGSNENTGYLYVNNSNVFKLSIKNGSGTGYSEANPIYQTTFGRQGFNAKYSFNKPDDVFPEPYLTTDPDRRKISPHIFYDSHNRPIRDERALQLTDAIAPAYNSKNGMVRTISNPENVANKVEVRQTLAPSDDGKYLILEYKVHNLSASRQDFIIGTAADLALIEHDNGAIVVTEQDNIPNNGYQGVHLHATGGHPKRAHIGGGHVFSTLDIYTDMPKSNAKYGLGIDRRPTDDKSRLAIWAGDYQRQYKDGESGGYQRFRFAKLGQEMIMENGDTSVNFSAYFDLQGNETKTARFAIATKEHVYYVNGAENSSINKNEIGADTGYMSSPIVKLNKKSSIERVLEKTSITTRDTVLDEPVQADNNGQNKDIYIMLQADEVIDQTITIPDGYVVRILTADYQTPEIRRKDHPEYISNGGRGMSYNPGNQTPRPIGNTEGKNRDGIFTLTRAKDFTGPLFKVESGATLDLSNVYIDGNKAEIDARNASVVGADGNLLPGKTENEIIYVNSPLIENAGNLIIGTGTTLQNADTSHTRSLVKTGTTYKINSVDPSNGTTTEVEHDGFTFGDLPNNANQTKASAIYSTGKLTFKGGTIKNNVSADSSNATTNGSTTASTAVIASGAVVIDNDDPNAVELESRDPIIIKDNTTMRYRSVEHKNPDGTYSTKEMTRIAGGHSNLYLRNDSAVLKVKNSATTGSLNNDTKIGLRINNPPETTKTGRLVVQREPESGAMTFDIDNFLSDAGSAQLLRMGQTGHEEYTGAAPTTDSATPGTMEGLERLYVKRLFSTITYNYVDGDGTPITVSPETDSSITIPKANGSRVYREFGTYANHKIDSVTVTPSDTDFTLSDDKTKLTINNLTSNVIVNIRYVKISARYTFDLMLNSDGETTDNNIRNITTTTPDSELRKYEELVRAGATSSTITAPLPSRLGYEFMGWKKYKNVYSNTNTTPLDKAFNPQVSGDNGPDQVLDTTAILSLTIPAPTQERDEYYYALWKQNVLSVPLSTKITNNNPNLEISFQSKNDGHPAGSRLNLSLPGIPGYVHHANVAGKRVESTDFASTVNTSASGYEFIGTMPTSSASVVFKYDVDTQKKFRFTVIYEDEAHNQLSRTDGTPYSISTEKNAEELISSQKETIPGYTYSGVVISSGRTVDRDNYQLGLDFVGMLRTLNDGQNGTNNTGEFEGYMPNQDVEVRYIYRDDSPSTPYRKIVIDDDTHKDNGKTLLVDKMTVTPGPSFPIANDTSFSQFYGLTYSRVVDPSTIGAVVDAQGNVGNYTQNSGGTLILGAKKGSEWNALKFGFVNNGFESNANMQYPTPGTETVSILTTDGSNLGNSKAMTFATIKTDALFPNAVPNNYYLFDGWFKDVAGSTSVQDGDIFTKATNAPFEQKIYAKIIEDPSKWVDVNFVSADTSLGTLSPVTTEGIYIPGSIAQHLHFDATWNTITKPLATPIANYELKGFIAPDGRMVRETDVVQAGTYTAVFGKRDEVWGLNVGAFSATGGIGSDGSGMVSITGTTPGNVYVITDPDGNIVGVANGMGTDFNFPGMVPGRVYNVIEGAPDTVAVVGSPASSITGSNISSPKPVIIPAIGDNKSVGVDPKDPEKAQIVINPADPDAEYALIDSNGNVVIYPNSDGGFMTPLGTAPATVTFDNLDQGETYTVVARKKGNTAETPLGNANAGVPVVANPGSMVEAQNYTIETKTNGMNANVKVQMIAGETVDATIYEQAKANSEFIIHADATDGAGNPFMYWMIMNGRIPGVSGKIMSADYNAKIAQSNVVFHAIYDVRPKNAAGEFIAPVEQANRGNSSEGEFALDPSLMSQLENNLANPTDISLINVNGADVRYKVLFDKRATKPTETNLIKNEPSQVWSSYPDAFTTTWSLDIREERYVDGRLVQNATPSNASVRVSVQLEGQDADMLDYEIWDLGPTVDGSWNVFTPTMISQIAYDGNVENNAGYMSFDGNLNHTYVLVYAKTFKLYFIDNNPTLDHKYLGDTNRNFFKKVKVRKKDTVTSMEYLPDYNEVTDYADQGIANNLVTPFDDIYGVTHTYENWSKKNMPLAINVFDPDSEVTKTQSIFAYYKNNRVEVTQARTDLTNLIPIAVNLRSNPYLRSNDLNDLNTAIASAQNVLNRIRGHLEDGIDPLRMANYPELQAEIEALQRVIDRINGIIDERNNSYLRRTGGGGGGTGSSGRGGGGANGTPLEGTAYKHLPLSMDRQNTFTLGVDGRWVINSMTGRWAFELNGGLPLNNKWARIDYKDSTGVQVTDWYRFDHQSSMATGWYYDTEYKGWYYLNPNEGKDMGKMVRGWFKDEDTGKWYYLNKEWGSMKTGWHEDPDDGKWYYFDPSSGEMAIGWHFIDGKWYFFNIANSAPTWSFVNGKWEFIGNNIRPYGSMYENEITPDGYSVNADGVWVR